MECPWRRTLASVLLLLSPHSILCQDVMPPGLLQTLPLSKEPLRDNTCMNPGTTQQQINLIPSPNSMISEIVPRNQYSAEFQRLPEYIGQAYPKACSVPQSNTGSLPPGVAFGIPQISNVPQIQASPLCKSITNNNIPTPQASFLNVVSTSLVADTSPITKAPIQEISACSLPPQGLIAKYSNFDLLPEPFPLNLPGPQRVQSKISPVSVVPNLQVVCPQRPQVTTTGSALNLPAAAFPNRDTLTLPMVSNSYSQLFVQPPVSTTCNLKTDLKQMNYVPTPNIPKSIPLKNCGLIPQVSVQPVVYNKPIVPVEYVSSSPVLPNCQISDLPPVFLADLPQFNNNFCRNPVSVTEESTPVPINLQINVPPPTIPEPQITIIMAYPPAPPVPATLDSSDVSFGLYPPYPLPPIIIEGRRTRARSLLPLILMALIANDGCCSGGNCCCCPCGVAGSDTPIPYPIPIPTNNPIILGSKSRKNSSNGTCIC